MNTLEMQQKLIEHLNSKFNNLSFKITYFTETNEFELVSTIKTSCLKFITHIPNLPHYTTDFLLYVERVVDARLFYFFKKE